MIISLKTTEEIMLIQVCKLIVLNIITPDAQGCDSESFSARYKQSSSLYLK